MTKTIQIATLGTPRIGPHRELKTALESYWAGKASGEDLQAVAKGLRAANWRAQKGLGITHIPSNDFSFYDHVLDTSVMVGAIPAVYGWAGGEVDLDTYFAMGRGSQGDVGEHHGHSHAHEGHGLPAQEMTKWFDTNYHYMVPEFADDQSFALTGQKPVDEFLEAWALGIHTRPVLVGPVTFLKLGKAKGIEPLTLLFRLLPVYQEVLKRLAAHGADWVQIDEPVLALDFDAATHKALRDAYANFARNVPSLKIMLTSYFGGFGDNLDLVLELPVAGLHVDLVRAPEQLEAVLVKAPLGLVLELGVIDGRNVWRANLPELLDRLEPVVSKRGTDHVILSPSCSLLHVPVDLDAERDLDGELISWLAFARQKMGELATLGRALTQGRESVAANLADSTAAAETRRVSPRTNNAAVDTRVRAVGPEMARRVSEFARRREAQQAVLKLPAYPTTTIGSFPQTKEVRQSRAAHLKGNLSDADYEAFLRRATADAISWQEEIGIDVLVHGEFERNDMVQYFGEQLDGYAFTRAGWVQSYGSRCVRPPIIFGDVSRPKAMSVDWASFAQSLTDKPVKGMLTGPVTMLQWSFVRDDQPRAETCVQIALALRDEVGDLEAAGISIIQVDEPALREGLPLRKADWEAYLDWAVRAFKLSVCGVGDETQIHTHMCYAEFNDIIDAIGAMDADVISIETSRSKMELLEAFAGYRYPNDIGPGVYDIHSPRVPERGEMVDLLRKAGARLGTEQIWVNPDCGLKTRGWDEVRPALVEMVEAARALRAEG